MEFLKNSPKDHQFLEVDKDLRRIAEREANKPLCPFGNNCYRRNPNHLQEYRHQKQYLSPNKTKPNDKNGAKRVKITDFFGQKPNNMKKLSTEPHKDNNPKGYEIEDSEEETVDKPNASICRELTPKRKTKTSFNTNTETNPKDRPKNVNNESDTDLKIDFKSVLNDDKCLLQLKPKPLNIKSKKKTCSPNVRKLRLIEETIPNSNKTANFKEDSKIEPKLNQNKINELKYEKLGPQLNPKMTSNQWNQLIKEIFLLEMPKDFFQFWEFCKTIKRETPEEALMDTLGLRLVGPYDVMTGKVDKSCIKDGDPILCHYRYFYDLPEFQTTMASNKSGYHLGYFRDTPEEDNPIVVSNDSDRNCIVEGVADNTFAAIYYEIQKQKSRVPSDSGLKQIESKLKGFCDINKIDLKANTKLRSRKAKINAKTFNSFGFIVPYDKKTEVGYRPLPLTDSELKKLIKTILKVDSETRSECNSLLELQEIIQLVSYANDECDFGMGLELGIDLFCFGDPFFHKSAIHLLSMAYDLLKRDAFSRIIKAHLQNRRQGFNLNQLID